MNIYLVFEMFVSISYFIEIENYKKFIYFILNIHKLQDYVL